jgi:hypothetical protein
VGGGAELQFAAEGAVLEGGEESHEFFARFRVMSLYHIDFRDPIREQTLNRQRWRKNKKLTNISEIHRLLSDTSGDTVGLPPYRR